MLRPCSESEFEKYIDFAYELATDPTKSGYPTYCDKIKTKEMFIARSREAFCRETEQMLLFEYDGEVQGFIHLFLIPEDNYLSTLGFNIGKETEQALAEFLAFVGERYSGYDLFLGFPADNVSAVDFLRRHGFECIEDDYNNTAFLDRLGEIKSSGAVRIGRDNFESFRALHTPAEADMYWTSERIFAAIDSWNILMIEKDGEPQGAVYYMNADDGWHEIFGIDINNGEYSPALFRELLNAALRDAGSRGGRAMTFFCDEKYEVAARECGFICIGRYLLYKTHLE